MAENEQKAEPIQRIEGTALTIDELGPGAQDTSADDAGTNTDEGANTGEAIDTIEIEVEAGGQDPDADRPKGWDQVDFQNDDRTAIEARFHRLYGQVKQQERVMDQMATDNRSLYERMQNWEVGQQQQNVQTRVGQLQASLQEAMDEGDAQRTAQLVREMTQLEAMSAAPPPPAPPAPPQQAGDGEHPDVALIRNWAEARPYAQEGHKDRAWVAFQLNDLYSNPEWANRPVQDKLTQIDSMYGEMRGGAQPNTPTPNAPVLGDGSGGGGRRRGRSQVDQLSEAQKTVAVHMFPEKNPRDAYSAYARGLK